MVYEAKLEKIASINFPSQYKNLVETYQSSILPILYIIVVIWKTDTSRPSEM